jgi:endonuclease/exonuclease/phosphatase family metal-dependent hydrolase
MTVDAAAIRVATWNIRAAIGPGEPFPPAWWRHVDLERLAAIAALIRDLDADVVALQEVAVFTASGRLVDQPAALAMATGVEVRYTAAHAFALVEPETDAVIGTAMWGNALLARGPFEDVIGFGLPFGGDDEAVEPAGSDRPLAGVTFADAPYGTREPRSIIGARLRIGPSGLTVLGTHLTYAGTGQRRVQASALAELTATQPSPLVVMGDFNAAIEAPELQPLASNLDDAFAAVGVPPSDERRASSGPNRIDHILTRGLGVADCRVERSAGDLSDHLPVVATLVASEDAA